MNRMNAYQRQVSSNTEGSKVHFTSAIPMNNNNNIENGRQTISYSFLIFKGKQTRKVTCFWGGQKCRNWTNTEEVENFCDDPEVGHLSRKYEDCDDYRYRWTELGLDLHSTEITNNRKFWLVYVYTRYHLTLVKMR